MTHEIWKPVDGFENSHEVSNMGNVRTIPRMAFGRTPIGLPCYRPVPQRGLKLARMTNGYLAVSLCVDGAVKRILAHRLVALAFCKHRDGCNYVNHKNGNKADNRAENLEWVTASENTMHAHANGLVRKMLGSSRAWAKLSEENVAEIKRRLALGENQRAMAREFGVAPCKITMIKQGKAWKHVA